MKLLIFCVILMATYAEAQELAQSSQGARICYTQWFDQDNPNGSGDYETIKALRAAYPGKICTRPLSIQAATLTGVSAESIGQVFEVYSPVSGFSCVNSAQRNEECCLDYKVCFGCPCPWPLVKPVLSAVEAPALTNATLP